MKKKTLLFIFPAIIALWSLAATAAEPAAAAALGKLRSKMLASPSVEAMFTINGGSGPVQGNITMAGSSFAMSTPMLSVWYDGKTQWAMLENTGEVNITEPTADDLMMSNPFAILSAHESHYKSRKLADKGGATRIALTPVDKTSGIAEIIIGINKTSGWPSTLNVTFTDGRQISVKIDSITAGKKMPKSTFTYNPKLHPAMEIIDLR